jgi:hypothetical protein
MAAAGIPTKATTAGFEGSEGSGKAWKGVPNQTLGVPTAGVLAMPMTTGKASGSRAGVGGSAELATERENRDPTGTAWLRTECFVSVISKASRMGTAKVFTVAINTRYKKLLTRTEKHVSGKLEPGKFFWEMGKYTQRLPT